MSKRRGLYNPKTFKGERTMAYEDTEVEQLKEKVRELSGVIKQIEAMLSEASRGLDSLREQKKEVRQKLQEKLNEKKKLLEEYKKLKSELKACYASRSELIKQLKSIENDVRYPKSDVSIDEINERIKNIEWTIHTSILKPSEERRLFLESKKLEEVAILIKKRESLIASINAQNDKINSIRNELNATKSMLEDISEEISRIKEEYENLKKKYEEKRKDYMEIKERLSRAEAERILFQSKLTLLMERLKTTMDNTVKRKEEEAKKRVISEVKQKLLKGKSVTFQELKLLLENDEEFKL